MAAVAAEIERETDESGPPSRSRQPDETFFTTINGFPEPRQERLSFYVYQLQPVVDLTKGGTEPKYRTVFERPFTEEKLKEECGSGRYQIRVNERNDKGKQTTVLTHQVEIYDIKFPPKLPYGPWVEDERNARWVWGHKKELPAASGPHHQNGTAGQFSPEFLTAFATAVDKLRPNQIKADDSATVLKTVLDASRQGGEQTYQMMKSHFEANDPGKFLESVKTVLEIAMPKKAEGVDPMLTFIMGRMEAAERKAEAAQKATNDLLMKMIEKGNEPAAKGLLGQVSELAQASNALREAFGGDSSAKTTWLDFGREMLSPIVTNLAPVGAFFLQRKIAESQAKATQPQPAQTGMVHHMPPATSQPTQHNVPPVSPTPPAEPVTITEDNPQVVAMMNLAQWAASALMMRMDGSVFAEEVVVKNLGDLGYDQVTSVPKEQLIAIMQGFPPAWQLLAPYEAQLPQFLDEFYSYGQEEEPPPGPIAPIQPVVEPTKAKRPKKGMVQ